MRRHVLDSDISTLKIKNDSGFVMEVSNIRNCG